MKVKLYTTPSCAYCHTLKVFLRDHGVAFEEVDILHNEKERDEIIERSGQMTAPILDIDGQIIVGFSREKICKLLNIKD